ncbi:MAG: Ldh family oxidoreductase [Rhodospirillaceae bacterium]|nr:Ldh family oxidoreductase [Rhodospirillaceae bacterium]
MMTDRIHLTVEEAQDISERAMRGVGYDAEEARILADHVMDCALCGYEYSGLPKLLNIVDAGFFQEPRQPYRIVKETAVSALIDGGNNVGMLAIHHATQEAIARATRYGFAIICLSNSWMSGRSAHYCEMMARAGLVGIHTVSAHPLVAPFGGAARVLGTNPIAFGFPCEGDPLVIDMGTSAFMGTDLQFRERMGTPIPEGVALDPQGRPTTDAGEGQRGALLPFGGPEGGYKGFGLALAMEALGVLCASARAPDDIRGYMIIAFKPDLFIPLEDYRRDLAQRIAAIKASPKLEGVDEIRIPGERSYRTRDRLRHEGIEIDRKIYDALGRLAEGQHNHGAGPA